MKDLHERLENSTAMNLIANTEFLGALIGGAASLVGGLFGKSSADKKDRQNARNQQKNDEANRKRVEAMNADVRARAEAAAKVPIVTTTSGFDKSRVITSGSVDIAAMMAAAEKSGFNPVTFLRNGGMAAYAKSVTDTDRKYGETQTVTGAHAMDAALAGQQIFQSAAPYQNQAPGYGEVFGNALTTGANLWVQDYNQKQQNAFQMQLMNAQLAGNNRAADRRAASGGNSPRGGGSGFGTVPKAYLTGSYETAAGVASLASKTKLPELWKDYWDQSNNRVVRLPNPDIADSEQVTAALAGSAYAGAKQPVTNIDNRKQGTVNLHIVNPTSSQPGMPGSATLGDIGNALSKYFEPWWNNQPIPGTSW